MKFLKNFFKRKETQIETSESPQITLEKSFSEALEEHYEKLWGASMDTMYSAGATAMAYKSNGWYDVIKNDTGKVLKIWLQRKPDDNHFFQCFLIMIAAQEKLDGTTFMRINQGKFRVATNQKDDKGGYYVLFGLLDPGRELT